MGGLTNSAVGFYVGLYGGAHIQGWKQVRRQKKVRISRKKRVLWKLCEGMRGKNWGSQNRTVQSDKKTRDGGGESLLMATVLLFGVMKMF